MPTAESLPLAAFAPLAHAKSFAVIGAARSPHKVGHQIFRNLLQMPGARVYPVNPHARRILDHDVLPTFSAVKPAVEVVIIATPAATVFAVINEIIDRNRRMEKRDRVRAVVIISAGFAETNKAGATLQAAIATKLTLADIQLLGPNSLGYVVPSRQLNASFAQAEVPAGSLGVISQSGAMLTLLFDTFYHEPPLKNVGISFAVSLGNKAGLSETDILRYAWHDTATRAVIMYLESFHDLPSFMELVSQVSKEKPVVLLKGGISERGQRASASHTAALATNQVLLEWAARQAGCIIVHTIEELVYLGSFLSMAPAQLDTVLVMTNAGGPGVNTTDTIATTSLQLATWSAHSRESCERLLPGIPLANPFDLLGDASPERFAAAIQLAQREPAIDSILAIVTPQAVTDMRGITELFCAYHGRKPLIVSLIGGDHLEKYRQRLRDHGIISPPFPNDGVTLLHHAHQATAYRYQTEKYVASQPHTSPAHLREPAMRIPTYADAMALLKEAELPLPKWRVVQSASEASTCPLPAFAKTGNLSMLHKKELGGVFGMVKTQADAAAAVAALKPFGNDIVFQEPIAYEQEILIGVNNDPQYGMYLTIGMGGSASNLIADRAYAFLPTTRTTLQRVWRSTKAFQALATQPERQTEVLEILLKIQKLLMRHPAIRLLEFNPLVTTPTGCRILDIKIQM